MASSSQASDSERHKNGKRKEVKPAEPSFMEKLADTLYKYRKVAAFSTGGRAENMPRDPEIDVDGVGRVAFPIVKDSAEKIISVCEKAPYGKGMETVVDETVRKTWQLNPSAFSINNPDWNIQLIKLVDEIGEQLGFKGRSVEARLYKFLLYEKGSHFKKHRDSEKSPGMFATLIVQLPSRYEGGSLIVQHNDLKETYNFQRNYLKREFNPKTLKWLSPRSPTIYYAAHFADVEHSVEEVNSGYRCVLVYNLCRKDLSEPPSSPPMIIQEISELLVSEWKTEPEALVFPLNHLYSYKGFTRESTGPNRLTGTSSLKGFDAILAAALKVASKNLKFDDEISLYICNAEKVTERDAPSPPDAYFGLDNYQYDVEDGWYWGLRHVPQSEEDSFSHEPAERKQPLLPGKDRDSVEEKPKYLREKDPEYERWKFEHDNLIDSQTFEGDSVCYLECFKLMFEKCLVAHTFNSEQFWKFESQSHVGWTGNEGPGIREFFRHTVIVAIKKSKENNLVHQQGNIGHIIDYILQKRNTAGFKEYFISQMKWLLENWPVKANYNWLCMAKSSMINKVFCIIADLSLCEIFRNLCEKFTTTAGAPGSLQVKCSQEGLRSCLMRLPLQVVKEGLLKIFARDVSMVLVSRRNMEDSEIFACIQLLGALKERDISCEDFRSFCETIVKVMENDIAYIDDLSGIVSMIKKFGATLPVITDAFPRRLIQLKSKYAELVFKSKWVYLIKQLAEAGVANIKSLVEAALPGIKENPATNPEDLIEFVQLLQEIKSIDIDIKELVHQIVVTKSVNAGGIELIKLLADQKLGDISQLAEISLPGFLKNTGKMEAPVILEMFQLLKKIRPSEDIQQIAVEVVKTKPLSTYQIFLGKYSGWFWLIRELAKAKIADMLTLVLSALPGLKNNESIYTDEIVHILSILIKANRGSEIKDFCSAVGENTDREYHLEKLVSKCIEHFGEAIMKTEGLQPLVTALASYAKRLDGKLKEAPQFNWCMPMAEFRNHPEVEDFLKGPDEIMYYEIFDSMELMAKFTILLRDNQKFGNYTATADLEEQGSRYRIVIKKTKEYFSKTEDEYRKIREKLEKIKHLISLK